ncbi:MAG: DUF4282 domain-containing protein [Phenylobacterium sp.]
MFDLKPNSRPAKFTTEMLWDLMSFENLMTRQVIHLIYWSGLGVTALIGFGFIGTAVGVAIREQSPFGILLGIGILAGGVLVIGILALLWRAFCELYVALFRLSDDIHALREANEAEADPAESRRA